LPEVVAVATSRIAPRCALLFCASLTSLTPICRAQPAIGGALGSILSSEYVDERHLTLIRFGEHHSHYLQPWRAWLETVPAHRLLQGIGVAMPAAGRYNPDLICRMLAEHGFTCGRVEIGWGQLNYDDETKINGADRLRDLLAAMGRHGIRPLILLNAHQGVPCPTAFFDCTVAEDAAEGSRTLLVDDTRRLRVGYSGPRNLTKYWAAEALITAMDGNRLTLSKPLPKAVQAGTQLPFATLKYRPFSEPGTDDYRETMAGWQRYTRTVAGLVADALGTAGQDDLGFDIEVWNELTFGTEFLYLNHYHDPKLVEYDERSIWKNLVEETAAELEADPPRYAGVTLVNGFGNTIPWTASSEQPARVGGICKHPYAGPKTFPQDEHKSKGLDATGKPTDFVPSYLCHFPEYYGCAIQTETMCRDLAPFTTDIYRTVHGRLARTADQGGPCPVWITEVNFDSQQRGITDPAEAMRLKAKAAARYFCFYLNKGVEKLFLYNATGHDKPELDFATISAQFADYAKQNADWPEPIDPYVSPQLRIMKRITDVLQDGLDPSLGETRTIGVAAITDEHGHHQFAGNGTPECPPLYNREVLAVLPYQVSEHKFVIAYYVMTRDVVADLPPEGYTITLTGLNGEQPAVRVYDPVGDRDIPADIERAAEDSVTLKVLAADYPYLLVVSEGG
jgi:hypothetical protein